MTIRCRLLPPRRLLVALCLSALALLPACRSSSAPVALPTSAEGVQQAKVLRAFDGDTLLVELQGREEHVRLIGVDTPERARDGRPTQQGYAEATKFLTDLVDHDVVTLEGDPLDDDKDRFGRLLRYVRIGDGTSVAEAIIAAGLGTAYTRFPFQAVTRHVQLEQEAIEQGRGLWDPAGMAEISWRDARTHMGQAAVVTGRIVATRRLGNKVCFLNFHPNYRDQLSLVIFGPVMDTFPPEPESYYKGKQVRVVGRITPYKGGPQLILDSPRQITVLEE